MARNIEIKARVPDLTAVRSRALALASAPPQVLSQTDTFFIVPKGRLKIREFPDGSGELISYERPDQPGPKESVYTRAHFHDAAALSQTLTAVLPIRGRVVKRREVLIVGRTRIHLDEVENLGSFVELEVVLRADESVQAGEIEASRLLEALAISSLALVPAAYIDLLEGKP